MVFRARSFGRSAVVLLALVLGGCGGGAAVVPHGVQPAGNAAHGRSVRTVGSASYQDVCATPAHGRAACAAMVPLNPSARHQPGSAPSGSRRTASAQRADDFPSYGWWPSDVQAAYGLPAGPRAGAGMTVAIVDAFDGPTAESDLATFRAFFNLPPCTTQNGCFKKVNAHGKSRDYPPSGQEFGWTTEIALDLDAVSGACPNCKIVLVEADSDAFNDLADAARTAGRLGDIVSNSYYGPEVDPFASPGDPPMTSFTSAYRHPGAVFVAATGDYGYEMQNALSFGYPLGDGESPFPAGIPDVVAVGGTMLSNTNYPSGAWVETAAPFTGGGCSTVFEKPIWQMFLACPHRMTADVAATADGLSIYDSLDYGGWADIGGTSASTPIIAGVYALARANGPVTVANLYLHANALNDVNSGNSGSCGVAYFCNARTGYDGPTGMGSPNGTRAFRDLF